MASLLKIKDTSKYSDLKFVSVSPANSFYIILALAYSSLLKKVGEIERIILS